MDAKARAKAFRPPVRLVMTTPVHLLAFGGGAGLLPWIPGTFGTIVGVVLWAILAWLPITAYGAIVLVLFVAGCFIAGRSAKLLGVHDHPGIVIDEIVGFLVSGFPLVYGLHWWTGLLWPWVLAAFVLFRFFDMLKPPPIRWFDRHVRGGFGIMLDDLLAAVPTVVLLMAAQRVVSLA